MAHHSSHLNNEQILAEVTPKNLQRRIIPILLLGASGVGKSSFIARTTGNPAKIGHGVESCTSNCEAWDFEYDVNTRFTLIDTPGFDDTTRDDMEILASIVSWMEAKNLPPFAGVIYFHRITDKRVTGTNRMNLQILRAMCGIQFYPHIILTTTMWGIIPNETIMKEAADREKNLLQLPAFWGDMRARGCKYERFMGNQQSGIEILSHFLPLGEAPPLAIEAEYRAGKTLQDTSAAAVILEERRQCEQKRHRELEEQREEEEEERLREMAERDRALFRAQEVQRVSRQGSQIAMAHARERGSTRDRPSPRESYEEDSDVVYYEIVQVRKPHKSDRRSGWNLGWKW